MPESQSYLKATSDNMVTEASKKVKPSLYLFWFYFRVSRNVTGTKLYTTLSSNCSVRFMSPLSSISNIPIFHLLYISLDSKISFFLLLHFLNPSIIPHPTLPYKVKTQYVQISNIIDTSFKHPISGQSISLIKGCMDISLIW